MFFHLKSRIELIVVGNLTIVIIIPSNTVKHVKTEPYRESKTCQIEPCQDLKILFGLIRFTIDEINYD